MKNPLPTIFLILPKKKNNFPFCSLSLCTFTVSSAPNWCASPLSSVSLSLSLRTTHCCSVLPVLSSFFALPAALPDNCRLSCLNYQVPTCPHCQTKRGPVRGENGVFFQFCPNWVRFRISNK